GTLELNKANNTQIIGTGFVVEDFSLSLSANQSGEINVYANAIQEGPFSAILKITYAGVDYEVNLSATGLPEGIVIIGTETVDLSLPIKPNYGYSYSQSIFLQNEINIPDKRIEKISYYWNGAGTGINSNLWTIYMGHTDLTQFNSTSDWIDISELTPVFTGTVPLTAEAGWKEITLDSPFIYDNTYNLVIAVDENKTNYDSYSQYFYCTTSSLNRSIIFYSDGTNPEPANPPTTSASGYLYLKAGFPNIKLQFGELPAEPVFHYSPTSINFGEVVQGVQVGPQYVTVTNFGGGTLVLSPSAITITDDPGHNFSFDFENEVGLYAGMSVNIPVYVTAHSEGPVSAILKINYAGTDYDVALSATGLPAGIVVIGTGTEDLSL
ncbi:MAG TPA: choice-of-anchor D domain-containing protein, partial [Candidatus Syntrophosphaera sp.]|nr:choice-of-anchor D domain-containing protein [Candidatus Syntrophosphaera sp.]